MSTSGNPNILLIIADDLGRDVVRITGAGGNRRMQVVTYDATPTEIIGELPNVSLFLRNGLLFDQAWAHPACSPTRASIYTGTHPWKNGIGNPGVNGLAENDPELDAAQVLSLPKMLPADYACGLFGKWHLGNQRGTRPTAHGWDKHAGTLGGVVSFYYNWTKDDSCDYLHPQNTTVYVTEETVKDAGTWINSLDPETPWFATIAFHSPHSPFHLPLGGGTYSLTAGDDTSNDYKFNAMAQTMDYYIGALINPIPVGTVTPIPTGQLENTIVIFLGDNGSDRNVAIEEPKTTIFEGGVRVPLIIADGQAVVQEITTQVINPRFLAAEKLNATSLNLAHVIDLYKTIAKTPDASVSFPTDSDSNDLARLYTETEDQLPVRHYNFSQYFWTENSGEIVRLATIRNRNYKLNYDSRTPDNYQLFQYADHEIPNREDDGSATDLFQDALTGVNAAAQRHLHALLDELIDRYRADDEKTRFPDPR